MNIPADLLYTKNHEWISIEENLATIGITDYAQSELGDIIFLELPEKGETVTIDNPFGTIEAIKTVADLFAPLSGNVITVNETLNDSAEKVNNDPYGEGWIIKIELSDPSQQYNLLNAEQYAKIID